MKNKLCNLICELVIIFCVLTSCSQNIDDNHYTQNNQLSSKDVAFLINDYAVPQRYITLYKKMCGGEIDSDDLHKLVKYAAMNAEAEMLGIMPDFYAVEFQMNMQKEFLSGSADLNSEITVEEFRKQLYDINMSEQEYLEFYEKYMYYASQRKELWEYVEQNNIANDYEKYAKKLLKKSKIIFVDKELEDLY